MERSPEGGGSVAPLTDLLVQSDDRFVHHWVGPVDLHLPSALRDEELCSNK